MMNYKVRELASGRFGVYACSEWGETLVKTFKTRKTAENWIKKNS